MGAYVCARGSLVQEVRSALLDTGRLKANGVTRFDARVWRALVEGGLGGSDGRLPVTEGLEGGGMITNVVVDGTLEGATEENHDEWAVHVFGLPPGQAEDEAMTALLESGEVRYVPDVRIGSPACYVDGGAGDRSGKMLRDETVGAWTPVVAAAERRRTLRERREREIRERGGRGVSPPRWYPDAHGALARAAVDGAGGSSSSSGSPSRTRAGDPSTPGERSFAPFTFSEMFAGVGGFGLALRSLGGTAVFASELCGHARKTYLANYAYGVPGMDGVSVSEAAGRRSGDEAHHRHTGEDQEAAAAAAAAAGLLMTGDITDVWEGIIPPHDILTGGFPCQSFSQRGDRLGLEDPRGQLYKEILRLLTACRPKAFILENVEGLARMDGGKTLELIVDELRGCGYGVHTKVFDAKGWVPQSRKRIYFVGFRDDLAGATERFAWPEAPETCGGTVEDLLEDEDGGEDEREPFEAVAACEVSRYQLDRAAAFFRRREGLEQHAGYLSPVNGVARTLCASYRKSSVYNAELVPPPMGDGTARTMEGGCHDEGSDDADVASPPEVRGRRPRYYTVREAARLQGFPETFHVDPERGYHELGNAVVPPLVRSVGEAVLVAMEDAGVHVDC